MKISKLIMYGFGPYAESINIDFEKLNEEGLFLITGNTGAGKTSIFDGITYALYGDVNLENSEKRNGLICDFLTREEHKNVFVELHFEVGAKNFIIKRTPKYMTEITRGKNKGEMKEEPETLEFYENGILKERNKMEIDIYIRDEVIRLKKDQFKKIIMLAQGAFNEFIKAGSDEKADILNKIFGTEFYKEFEEKLKYEVNEKGKTIEKEKDNIITILKNASITDNETWNDLIKNKVIDFEKQIDILKEKGTEILNYIKTEETKLQELKEKKDKIISEIEISKNLNEGIDKFKKSLELIEYLKEQHTKYHPRS